MVSSIHGYFIAVIRAVLLQGRAADDSALPVPRVPSQAEGTNASTRHKQSHQSYLVGVTTGAQRIHKLRSCLTYTVVVQHDVQHLIVGYRSES